MKCETPINLTIRTKQTKKPSAFSPKTLHSLVKPPKPSEASDQATTMAIGAFAKTSTATIPRLMRRCSIADLVGEAAGGARASRAAARAYLRLPQFVRKARDLEIPQSLFSSAFSSSSSSTAAAATKEVGIIGWYLGMVKCRPILTKSVTSSLIYTVADLSSQTLSKQSSDSYDLVRTSRMAGYAMLILGPSLHYWFNFMSKLFPKRDLLSTLKKMAMGQAIYGPTLTVIFFSINARLQGETGTEIVARLKRDMFPTLLNGVMYWPVCDFITFRFVPVHLQPLVSNSFSYVWTVYMTYMASLEKATAE